MSDPNLIDHKHLYEVAKSFSQVGKYIGGAATTALSIFSLVNETTIASTVPGRRKALTPAGKRYLLGIVSLALVTIAFSVAGDIADSRLAQISGLTFDSRLQDALAKKNAELTQALSPAFTGLNNQIGETTKRLEGLDKSTATVTKKIIDGGNKTEAQMLSMQQSTLAASERNIRSMTHVQENLEQAELLVDGLDLSLEQPFKAEPAASSLEAPKKLNQAQEQLKKCRAEAKTDQATDLCDDYEKLIESWSETRDFARSLNLLQAMFFQLHVALRSFNITLDAYDCSNSLNVQGPEFCFRAYTFEAVTFKDSRLHTSSFLMPDKRYIYGTAFARDLPDLLIPPFSYKGSGKPEYHASDMDIEGITLHICPRPSGAAVDENSLRTFVLKLSEQFHEKADTQAFPARAREYEYAPVMSTGKKASDGCTDYDLALK